MDNRYYRLDCMILRWNRPIPAVFLINDDGKSRPTVVYERGSYRSLDNKKGTRPRPIKALAYNFTRIEDEQGAPIITNRAVDAKTAGEFAERILAKAVPISRQEYLSELERVVWRKPNLDDSWQALYSSSVDPDRLPRLSKMSESYRALRSSDLADSLKRAFGDEAGVSTKYAVAPVRQRIENRMLLDKSRDEEWSSPQENNASWRRRDMVKELMDYITDMDADDLAQLLKHARLLRQED